MKSDIYRNCFNNILDVMTGADGGVKFVYFKLLFEALCERIDNDNDEAAKIVLDIVFKFNNMIEVAQKTNFEK